MVIQESTSVLSPRHGGLNLRNSTCRVCLLLHPEYQQPVCKSSGLWEPVRTHPHPLDWHQERKSLRHVLQPTWRDRLKCPFATDELPDTATAAKSKAEWTELCLPLSVWKKPKSALNDRSQCVVYPASLWETLRSTLIALCHHPFSIKSFVLKNFCASLWWFEWEWSPRGSCLNV